jgi:hypothetical protein
MAVTSCCEEAYLRNSDSYLYPTSFPHVAARDIFGSAWLAARAPYQQVPEWEGRPPQAARERDRRCLVEKLAQTLRREGTQWERDGRLYAIQSAATKQRAAV